MILLDTDVLVDVLRQYPPSLAWLKSLGTDVIGIPGLVALEVLQGCRNRVEQQHVERLLRSYRLYWPTFADCERAFADVITYRLSHGLSIMDALIAETAVGLDVQIATFNQKHYDVINLISTAQPYDR